MQGSKLSCELFVLYFGECMKELEEAWQIELENAEGDKDDSMVPKNTEYVDDLASVLRRVNLVDYVETMKRIFKKYNFTINIKDDGTKTAVVQT